MQELEQKFTMYIAEHFVFEFCNNIILKQNKIHKSINKMQSAFGGGGGVEFGLNETCFPFLSSGQKHKPKIGSQ